MQRAVAVAAIVVVVAGCGAPSGSSGAPDAGGFDAAQVVPDPRWGSGGFGYSFGSAFPGALSPNGLAKPGPDTSGRWGTINFLHYDGYWFGDDTIQGFSHVHLHGTGASDYGVLAVMPSDAFDAGRESADGSFGNGGTGGYQSKFDKTTEVASPGYYAATLARGAIRAELTATPHVAVERFTWPSAASGGVVIFDLDHHLTNANVTSAQATLDAASARVHGQLHNDGGMSGGFGGYDLFFEIRFKQPWTTAQVWSGGAAPTSATRAEGTRVGFELSFADVSAPIEVQVGLSFTSQAEAAANLAVEAPDFTSGGFDAVRAAAAAAWDAELGRVAVTGGSDRDRRIFLSAMHHLFVMPSVISDVDGGYLGQDKQPHTARGFHYVTDLSLWDTYRTLNPLYDLIAPDKALDVVSSLYEMRKAGGFWSKWPLATGDAGSMIGASAEVVVADAYLKGVTGFDAEGAYQTLRSAALDPSAPAASRGGRSDVLPYMQLGYVPATVDGSVSRTTEYGNDDFALGNLANALGHADDGAALLARRTNYRNLFDPGTQLLWAKRVNGQFVDTTEDPTLWQKDFTEADAWQSVWMAAHDVDGLVALFGGQQPFVDKLTRFFEQSKIEHDQLAMSGSMNLAPAAYYWAGNEPDIQAAFLFAQAGRPDLTQKYVRFILDDDYGDQADGEPGNDDGGALAAWFVWASIGLYPIAGSDQYVVSAPQFPHVEVKVPGGTFTIDAPDVSHDAIYVQSATLNGAPLTAPSLRHADLRAGGSLAFVMGMSPSSWGQRQ